MLATCVHQTISSREGSKLSSGELYSSDSLVMSCVNIGEYTRAFLVEGLQQYVLIEMSAPDVPVSR